MDKLFPILGVLGFMCGAVGLILLMHSMTFYDSRNQWYDYTNAWGDVEKHSKVEFKIKPGFERVAKRFRIAANGLLISAGTIFVALIFLGIYRA